MIDYSNLRNKMVDEQIKRRGVTDEKVLDVMRKVPRHLFVSETLIPRAYGDHPLPIDERQTISQPYMVACMTELLDIGPEHAVLEIGTGSGYQTAVLAELAEKVYTIDRHRSLVGQARTIFNKLNYHNIVMKTGDGTLGWKEFSPYDRILVTAGAPVVPEKLVGQLKEDGKIVVPVGDNTSQKLLVIEKKEGRLFTTETIACVFVPLIGKYGWSE